METVSFRLPDKGIDLLVKEANRNRRKLSNEIRNRLIQSFEDEQEVDDEAFFPKFDN
jgi:hypothetical protein